MAKFQFKDDGIGHVLSDRRLAVPIYQRSYSWTKDEVTEFWSDLIDTFKEGDQEYFIGNLVFAQEGSSPGTPSIIDGQQRLATTLLLIASIRDEHHDQGEEDAASDISSTFISTYDAKKKEHVERLRLNSEDQPFYRDLILGIVDFSKADPKKRSHEFILEAYKILREKVRDFAKEAGSRWYDELIKLREFIENRLKVVVVDVPTEADAFLIFETLNDRGADLTIADLLKNYLYRRAERDLESVRDAWMQALGALEVSAEERIFVTFLRHYWSSKHGTTRERDLFNSFKEHVTNRKQAVQVASEIKDSSVLYAAILNSEHDFWRPFGSNGKANVETLQRLKLEQLRPLLLAMMQHWAPGELKKGLRAVVSWGTRGLIVGGIGGGSAERAYCEAAVEVRKGAIKNVSELLIKLDGFVPTDDEFRRAFEHRRIVNARLARYYLYTLERTSYGTSEPELIPNQDEENVNLEHILPKNSKGADWNQFSDEEKNQWVHRLGNMVLLSKGLNDHIGNKPWNKKKPVLAKSSLQLTQRAAGKVDWTKNEIDESQENMAKLAVRAWPRKI